MASADILGHEYTHAVQYQSIFGALAEPMGLIGGGEPGTLAEGLADVFGEFFEAYSTGSMDWKIGTGAVIIARDIANAEATGYPTTTFSENFYCGPGDSGGIHLNSTIVSSIAYRLTEGDGDGKCRTEPIARDKVQKLFYRAMTGYLSIGSGFSDLYAA
jgi:Zn-dependent metalloprotease